MTMDVARNVPDAFTTDANARSHLNEICRISSHKSLNPTFRSASSLCKEARFGSALLAIQVFSQLPGQVLEGRQLPGRISQEKRTRLRIFGFKIADSGAQCLVLQYKLGIALGNARGFVMIVDGMRAARSEKVTRRSGCAQIHPRKQVVGEKRCCARMIDIDR
jgi:hypothetical protein